MTKKIEFEVGDLVKVPRMKGTFSWGTYIGNIVLLTEDGFCLVRLQYGRKVKDLPFKTKDIKKHKRP